VKLGRFNTNTHHIVGYSVQNNFTHKELSSILAGCDMHRCNVLSSAIVHCILVIASLAHHTLERTYLFKILATALSKSNSRNLVKGLVRPSSSTAGFASPFTVTTNAPLRGLSLSIDTDQPAAERAVSTTAAWRLNTPLA